MKLCTDAHPAHDHLMVRHSREIAAKLRTLAVMLRRHDQHCWAIGDLVANLVGRHRLRLGAIAKKVGYSKARLSEFHVTAKTFTADQRNAGFYSSLMARRIWKAMPRLEMTPLAIRAEIVKLRGKRPRQIRAHFVEILLGKEKRRALAQGIRFEGSAQTMVNQAHHGDWRDIVPRLPNAGVKLFICDPPFGGYSWRGEGGYLSGRADTNGLRNESDNNTNEAALLVTLPLFAACLPKLAPGGCLLLFQPGGKPDRPEVLMEAQKEGWACLYGLTWLKSTYTPSDCAYPYVPASERILVFARRDDRLEWHEAGLSRSDVLSFPSVTRDATRNMIAGRTPLQAVHMFQKPYELGEFLVRKHTHAGDLAVEPFGCSGEFSIAAARLGRRWVYIESNAENYRWGSQRIAEAVQSAPAKVG